MWDVVFVRFPTKPIEVTRPGTPRAAPRRREKKIFFFFSGPTSDKAPTRRKKKKEKTPFQVQGFTPAAGHVETDRYAQLTR